MTQEGMRMQQTGQQVSFGFHSSVTSSNTHTLQKILFPTSL